MTNNQSRRKFLTLLPGWGLPLAAGAFGKFSGHKPIRIGAIGLSVHSADFTDIINGALNGEAYPDCRVTQVFHPPGNPDVEFSAQELERFAAVMRKHKVTFAASIRAMIPEVDAVMLLTNDGRPHYDEILPLLKAGKPVYLDKPVADTFGNVLRIYREANRYRAPVYSASALRFIPNGRKTAEGGVVGAVTGAEVYGPAPLQASHTDLFWDGIHGVELLFTLMGKECRSVRRIVEKGTDLVVGTWDGNRIGTFRGIREGRAGFGGTAYGMKGIAPLEKFEGYRPLVISILDFFRSGIPPVPVEETIGIYAFMEAAEKSKKAGGSPVLLSEIPGL